MTLLYTTCAITISPWENQSRYFLITSSRYVSNIVSLISANTLGVQEIETILVIPPKRGNEEMFNSKHFGALHEYVTAFSLMTYDFSNPRMPGEIYIF